MMPMKQPYKSSIRGKVTTVIMLASSAVLLVTVAAFMVYDVATFRQAMQRNLDAQARLIAENSWGSLAFGNEADAANVLASLRTEPHIISAALYDAQGKLFVKYPAAIAATALPDKPQDWNHSLGKSKMAVFQPVIHSGRRLGTLYLQSDVTALTQRLELYGAISLLIMVGSLLIAFWLSNTLQRRISNPIIALAETARNVSGRRDFSIRAKKSSDDELGDLTDAFNLMLGQVQSSHTALAESEARLAAIFNQAGAGIAQCDLSGRFINVNERYCEITGRSREELLKLRVDDITYAEDRPENFSTLDKVNQGLPSTINEKRYVRPNGDVVWARVSVAPLRDAQGNVEFALAVAQDISDRKRHEAELAKLMQQTDAQARLFDATLSSIKDLAYTFDLEGNWIYANKALLQIWGKSLKEITGKSSLELGYPPVLAARLKQQVKEVVATRQPVSGETYFTDAAGVEDYHEYIFSPVLAADGTVTAVCGTTRLTTERKRAEELLRQNEALFSALVDQAPNGVYVVDAGFRLQHINARAVPAFENVHSPIGRDFSEVMHILWGPEVGDALAAIFRHTLDTGEPYISPDFSNIRADIGVEKTYEWQTRRVTLPNGSHGVVCYFNDITERIRSEQALMQAKTAAESANRSKDDFLAALSHELRTPLNPVLLMASDGAANPELSPETRAHFDMIRRNVELEARLIDDLLDLTRITRGKLPLEMRPLDVHVVLQEAIAIMQADADKKQIGLTLDFGAGQPVISGDAVRLQQIFWNVLKNAVKFTPEGGKINIETRTRAESGHWIVKITDTGIGLTAGEIDRIFNAFSQGEHASTTGSHRFGGLGLGLTISQMLVELHSGTITATSPGRDQGAAFTIEFPSMSAKDGDHRPAPEGLSPAAHSKKATRNKTGRRILLVEDHEATRVTLAQLLTRRNYQVMTATSVADARALAQQEKFDLVVSDIGLPDGDGYALMSELREKFALKGIALSGYGMEQDVVRGQNAGFVTHLIKPVRMESLEKALDEVM